MTLLGKIFGYYSQYTGMSILMSLFFVALAYVALKDKNRNNKTIILYGTVGILLLIFNPLLYYAYSTYVDAGSYWRVFWILPMAIGIAYVGAELVKDHRITGFLLLIFALFLGGKLVYTISPEFKFATNEYHINQSTVDVADYLDTLDLDHYMVAVPYEMLADIRQYNINIRMPYGREQYDEKWGIRTGFFELMIADNVDFSLLADKCRFNNTKYLVINAGKPQLDDPGENGFTLLKSVGGYEIYEYMGI